MKNKLRNLSVILCLISAPSLLYTGCTNLNRNVYNAENTVADAAMSSVSAYNAYYKNATNGATTDQIAKLTTERDGVWDASRKLSAVLLTVDNLRLQYAAKPTTNNQVALQVALQALTDQQSNIINTVKLILGK